MLGLRGVQITEMFDKYKAKHFPFNVRQISTILGVWISEDLDK